MVRVGAVAALVRLWGHDDYPAMMPRQPLLASQRAQVAQELTAAGLDLRSFEWKAVDSVLRTATTVACLSHKSEAGFEFVFDRSPSSAAKSYVGRRSPGKGYELEDHCYASTWEGQLRNVGEWAELLRRELDAEDPWESLESARQFVDLVERQEDNSLFTPDEHRAISRRLDEIESQIQANVELSFEQRLYVSRQIDYLRNAAGRLGRKDWLMLALGTVSNLAVGLALDASQAGPLAERVLHGVRAIWP